MRRSCSRGREGVAARNEEEDEGWEGCQMGDPYGTVESRGEKRFGGSLGGRTVVEVVELR